MNIIYRIRTVDKQERECWSKMYVNYETCLRNAKKFAKKKYKKYQIIDIYSYPVGVGIKEHGVI